MNGRYLGQHVTGVQRFASETTAALQRTLGADSVTVLRPHTADPLRAWAWELKDLSREARAATGSPATLNMCNWGPVRGLNSATVVVHDTAVYDQPASFSPAYRAVLKGWMAVLRQSSAKVATSSRRSQATLSQMLGRTVSLAPCGVEPAFRESPADADRSTLSRHQLEPQGYVMFVGAHDPRKNLAFALQLLPALEERGLRLAATYRKPAEQVKLKAVSAFSGNAALLETVDPRVQLIADPTDEDLTALYRNAVALVHPSIYEGFGLPLLEAAASGTPFLSSPVGGAEELAVDPAQVVDLDVDAWVRSLGDVIARRDFLSTQLRELSTSYTWERTAEELLTIVHA